MTKNTRNIAVHVYYRDFVKKKKAFFLTSGVTISICLAERWDSCPFRPSPTM